MSIFPGRTDRPHGASMFLAAAAVLLAFYLVGSVFLNGFVLDLGSLNFPTPRYVLLTAFWMSFGSAAAGLLAVAFSQRWGQREVLDRVTTRWNAVSDRRFLVCACAAAFAVPLLIRIWLLNGAPLTDDESAYRFAAQLLASGRLWVPSPKLKLFFDQNFMINDGRLYPVYFLGWPALLAVGFLVRTPEIVNPLLSALTVPALLHVLRQYVSSGWARLGIVLFLASPFVQVARGYSAIAYLVPDGTDVGHGTVPAARTVLAPHRTHAGFGLALAMAFCIRPPSAVALGAPLAAVMDRRTPPRRTSRSSSSGRGLPLSQPDACRPLPRKFVGAERITLEGGYARYAEYMTENQFRFTTFAPSDLTAVAGFDFSQTPEAVARTAAGLFRLNFDLFGWPSSFVLVLLGIAVFSRATALPWWMFASFVSFMLFQRDWGIDTFGPLHAFELSLPVLILTIVAARNLSERLAWTSGPAAPRWDWTGFPAFLLGALIVCGWVGFIPLRLSAVRQIALHVNSALQAPARAGLHRAVVFAPWPFAPPCMGMPKHFVLFRPVNDPDLQNDVLWVNHLGVEEDRALMETFPGRSGHVLQWNSTCAVTLTPLPALRSQGSLSRPLGPGL
jgi:hypothetical protein